MNTDLKIERRYVLLRDISLDPSFQFRQAGTDKGHVRGLLQVLRTVGDLDPVLVWQERDSKGAPTGRLVLLDGHHRLAAYASVRRSRGGIPARVLNGGLEEALLAAVRANSRECLALTKNERMDAAWRLVRLPGKRLAVPTVAGAAGVSPRSVDIMRKRLAIFVATQREPSGHWWRDRQDDLPAMEDRPALSDKERRKRITEVSARVREAMGKLPWQDEQLAADALLAAIGTRKLRGMAEYLFTDDEFAGDEGYFATDHEILPAASGEDF